MLSVFEYQNYRRYLCDYYEAQKRTRSGFTYAKFSVQAGIRSPNYLKLVIDAQKNLTAKNVICFTKALQLNETAADYFEALVQFNQAKNSMEKEFYQSRMKRVRSRFKGDSEKTLEEYEFESISNWLHHAIMVLTNVQWFRDNPQWIKQRLYNLATQEEVAQVLERLEKINLIHRDKDGRLRQSFRQIKTKPELQRVSAKMFYEGLLKRAVQALNICTPEEREYSAYIVGLSPEQVPELKKRVREFMKDLNDWAMETSKPSQVYAFTFAGFPLTRSTE